MFMLYISYIYIYIREQAPDSHWLYSVFLGPKHSMGQYGTNVMTDFLCQSTPDSTVVNYLCTLIKILFSKF